MTAEPLPSNVPEPNTEVSNGNSDPDLAKLANLLSEMSAKITAAESSAKALQEKQDQFDSKKQEVRMQYETAVKAIREQEAETKDALFELRKELRAAKQQFETTEYKFQTALKLKQAESEFKVLEQRWDALTEDKYWRLHIKPHQLEAARRITYSKSLILADTMGLGKTLSAYAAIDYIQAATADGETVEIPSPYYGGEPTVETYPPAGRRVLYICPAALDINVKEEFKHWGQDVFTGRPSRSVTSLTGLSKIGRRAKIEVLQEMSDFVVVINYEAWRKDRSLLNDLVDCKFDTVIIDEAHNIKDRKSLAYRGVRQILDGVKYDPNENYRYKLSPVGPVGEPAFEQPIRYVLPMTGTPVLNRPQELYSLLTLVDPHEYPDTRYGEDRFLRAYCIQNYYTNKWTFAPGGVDRLLNKVSHRILRRDRKSAGIQTWASPPQIHELTIDPELYPDQFRAREEMRKHAILTIGDPEEGKSISAPVLLALYTRLRQIETWPAGITVRDAKTKEILLQVDVEQSQKIDYLISYKPAEDGEYEGLITEVCPNERAVVFSQFKAPLHEIRSRCERAGLRVAILDGDTPDSIREEIRIDFDRRHTSNDDPANYKYDLVLCNYRVGGVGLNFTCATQVITLDETWNPGMRDQAYGRADRIGQTEAVSIHIIRVAKTIDTWLSNIIAEKEAMINDFEMKATDLAQDLKHFLEGN